MQAIKPVTKPTKQRKMLHQASDHIRHKLFAAPLSPELRALHGLKAVPVRSGDTVRIIRGDHKDFEGKITRINMKKYRIYVEGLTREKVDGTTIFVPLHPSKVLITHLNLDDKWRKEILERKKGVQKKVEEAAKKPPEEVVKEKEVTIEEKPAAEKKLRKKPKRREKIRPTTPTVEKVEEKVEEKPGVRKKPKRKSVKKTGGGA